MNETRIIVRLIALWIIFIGALGFAFFSTQKLALTFGEREEAINKDSYGMMAYTPTYTSCLMPPPYPGSDMGMGPEVSKAAMDKYNEEMAKYNAEYAIACKEDIAKQEKAEKSASLNSKAIHSVSIFLGIIVAAAAFLAVHKTENA